MDKIWAWCWTCGKEYSQKSLFIILAPCKKPASLVRDRENSFKERRRRAKGSKPVFLLEPVEAKKKHIAVDIVCTECGGKQQMIGNDHHPEWDYPINKDAVDVDAYSGYDPDPVDVENYAVPKVVANGG